MHDIYEKWTVLPGTAWFFLFLALTPLCGLALASAVRAIRRGRMAAAAEASVGDKPPPIVEGTDVVLCGTVRHFEADVAVKISITQSGSETESSGSWSHKWTEIDRDITVAPFWLDLPSGESVLVRPPKNPEVADALDQKVWINRNERVLSAELVPGEKIWARGRLERSDLADPSSAYRDVTWGWALQPAGNKMLLSSEPLGAGFRARARFHRVATAVVACVLAVAASTVAPFLLRSVGHTEHAIVHGIHEWTTTDDDNNETQHYGLQFSNATLGNHEEEISGSDMVAVHEGDEVPVRVASATNWQLGSEATLSWWHLLLLVITTSITIAWCLVARHNSRPWHKRKVHESGSGQLPDPP